MSRYWNPTVAELSPYLPGEQPPRGDLIKLNTNELPFGPSPLALEAIRAETNENLRLYPDPENRVLKKAFADALDILPEQVFLGNGSDEVLAHTFRALFQPNAPVLFPDITYSFYSVYIDFFGLRAEAIPLNERFEIDLVDYRRSNGGIIFPNPNAPTGVFTALEEIGDLLENNRDSVVVVDEAYIDFGGYSATALINDYSNLLVIQTLSKSRSLAGLRVGAALGQEELIEGLNRVKNSFNSYPLDRLAEVGGAAALGDLNWFDKNRKQVIENRKYITEELQALGFEVLPSHANFVFARHPNREGAELQRGLRKRSILVRHFDQPRISDFLRITIGSAQECGAVIEALSEMVR